MQSSLILLAMAGALAGIPAPIAEGNATFMLPEVVEQVKANRARWGQLGELDGTVGVVALQDCDRIGEWVGITWRSGERRGPYLVIDCACRAHYSYLDRIRFAVDVEQSEWFQHANVGKRGGAWVTVWGWRDD